MVRFILSLIFRLIVTIQSLVNLRITETAVYLRAVEVVAILGKDYALHLIGITLILEATSIPSAFNRFSSVVQSEHRATSRLRTWYIS